MTVRIAIDEGTLRHAAEIMADYACTERDAEVASKTLEILDALESADARPGAANLLRDSLETIASEGE